MEEAWQVARDVSEISVVGDSHERTQAALARGMVAAVAGVLAADEVGKDHTATWPALDANALGAAESDLLEVQFDTDLPAEQRLTAALYYLLATGGAAHNVPASLVPVLSSLHPVALRVLSGPADLFDGVWAKLGGPSIELTLRFLGRAECRWQGRDVSLPARLAEVAMALVLHPDGISRDELNTFLTHDGQPPFTNGGMRGMMTRLRGVLPVSEAPYRLTVPFSADILEVRRLIGAGKVREAIGMLHGQLLPHSDAPGVIEQRWILEEELRQAALLVGDADALYDLAERIGDDLEFWQAAADALGAGDPRLALARARVKRLADSYDSRS